MVNPMVENIMLRSVGANTQSPLYWSLGRVRTFLHRPAHKPSCRHETNVPWPWWTHVRTTELVHNLPETLSDNDVKGQWSRGPVLFLASLLELSSREDHVHPSSFGAEAALTLWEVTPLKVLSEAVEEDSSLRILPGIDRSDVPWWLSQVWQLPFLL